MHLGRFFGGALNVLFLSPPSWEITPAGWKATEPFTLLPAKAERRELCYCCSATLRSYTAGSFCTSTQETKGPKKSGAWHCYLRVSVQQVLIALQCKPACEPGEVGTPKPQLCRLWALLSRHTAPHSHSPAELQRQPLSVRAKL